LLLITTHIESDDVLRGRLDLQLLTELDGPLVDVRLELTDVSAECTNIVVSEGVLDGGVNLLSRDLSVVSLGVPDLDGEDSSVFNSTSDQRRPVAALRTVEPEGNRVTVFERTELLVEALIPLGRSDP